MEDINLDNTYWDRVRGYVTELRVDARWVLRDLDTKKPYGSLRIVSHPDLKAGYLRAVFSYITAIHKKNDVERLQTVEDYQIGISELEVYSINDKVLTEVKTYEAPFPELQKLFGVKIFE